HQVELKQFLNLCFRGQRIDSSSNKNLIECYEIGIKHFESYGFTNYFGECSLKSNSKKIQELRLAPYDILLSIRGVIPKVAIVGEEASNKIVIANAGILVLRIRSVDVAQALYLYCISKVGCETLSKLYQNNSERIGEREISHFLLPKDFLHGFKDKFESLCQEGERLKDHQKKIQEILGFL
ncbi:MAG: restriction endonuclease, partial [Helicobacter sp.]|nr:restriction endonuclease [Helicobacter sp.]